MSKRMSLTQQEKYIGFKKAFETISKYRSAKNNLAAYVITFSIIEDRIRAMFVVWHRNTKQTEPTENKINGRFSDLVKLLTKAGDISDAVANQLLEEAKQRNSLLHAAMWQLDAFTEESVDRAMNLLRKLDKLSREQKKNRAEE